MRGNVHVRFGGEARETRPLKGGRCALVLTLHLVFAPTLIFYEITFNLGTMMQAAGRSYRLNQTHTHCKTFYLFAEGTMEQTAVQLMSRKQRAAKLLTGDIGLTGLDALTEGEGGFEEALLEAIGRDETLLDPSELFRKSEAQGEIDNEDAAYWNVELDETEGEPLADEPAQPVLQIELQPALDNDPLIQEAIRLGGVVTEIENQPLEPNRSSGQIPGDSVTEAIVRYLDGVHIVTDEAKLTALHAELFDLLPVSPVLLSDWLRDNRVVFPGCEAEVAAHLVQLATQTLNDITTNSIELRPVATSTRLKQPAVSKARKRQPDLMALPDELEEVQHKRQRHEQVDETTPLQLALF